MLGIVKRKRLDQFVRIECDEFIFEPRDNDKVNFYCATVENNDEDEDDEKRPKKRSKRKMKPKKISAAETPMKEPISTPEDDQSESTDINTSSSAAKIDDTAITSAVLIQDPVTNENVISVIKGGNEAEKEEDEKETVLQQLPNESEPIVESIQRTSTPLPCNPVEIQDSPSSPDEVRRLRKCKLSDGPIYSISRDDLIEIKRKELEFNEARRILREDEKLVRETAQRIMDFERDCIHRFESMWSAEMDYRRNKENEFEMILQWKVTERESRIRAEMNARMIDFENILSEYREREAILIETIQRYENEMQEYRIMSQLSAQNANAQMILQGQAAQDQKYVIQGSQCVQQNSNENGNSNQQQSINNQGTLETVQQAHGYSQKVEVEQYAPQTDQVEHMQIEDIMPYPEIHCQQFLVPEAHQVQVQLNQSIQQEEFILQQQQHHHHNQQHHQHLQEQRQQELQIQIQHQQELQMQQQRQQELQQQQLQEQKQQEQHLELQKQQEQHYQQQQLELQKQQQLLLQQQQQQKNQQEQQQQEQQKQHALQQQQKEILRQTQLQQQEQLRQIRLKQAQAKAEEQAQAKARAEAKAKAEAEAKDLARARDNAQAQAYVQAQAQAHNIQGISRNTNSQFHQQIISSQVPASSQAQRQQNQEMPIFHVGESPQKFDRCKREPRGRLRQQPQSNNNYNNYNNNNLQLQKPDDFDSNMESEPSTISPESSQMDISSSVETRKISVPKRSLINSKGSKMDEDEECEQRASERTDLSQKDKAIAQIQEELLAKSDVFSLLKTQNIFPKKQ